MSIASCLENRREMESFEVGNEYRKMLFRLVTSVGHRKHCEFPWGIEPQIFEFRAPMLYD